MTRTGFTWAEATIKDDVESSYDIFYNPDNNVSETIMMIQDNVMMKQRIIEWILFGY